MLCLIVSPGFTAQAAEPICKITDQSITEGPNLTDLIKYAYENNPAIAASRLAWRAEVERLNLESGYPDPQLMVSYFTDPIETRLGPQDWNLTLSQPIPFPGKLGKKATIISADVDIARQKMAITVRDTIIAIQQSWYELSYIRTAKQITIKNNSLLEELQKIAETAQAEDRGTLTDVIKAQSQAGQLRYDLILLKELEETEIGQLNALLDRQPDEIVGEFKDQPLPTLAYILPELYTLSEKNRREIVIAQLKEKKAAAKHSLAQYSYLPDLKVGLFYADIGIPDVPNIPKDAGRDAVGIQVGMTIPLWFGKNRSAVSQATATLQQNLFLKVNTINQSKAKIRQIFFRLRNANRLIILYRDNLLPQSLATLNAAESWSREGLGSLSDLVEAQATVYNFQLSLARAQADYGKFFSQLEGVTGTSLNKKKPTTDEGALSNE